MWKSTVYGACWAVLIVGGAIFLGMAYNPLQLSGYVRQAFELPDYGARERLREIYDVSFVLEKAPSGNIVNYLPRLGFADAEQAHALAQMWGAGGGFSETESQYVFADENGELAIDKFGDHMLYTSSHTPTMKAEIDSAHAIAAADEFMNSRMPFFGYEEAITSFGGGLYEVLFIERLGNLKNYGFPIVVHVDGAGNVYSADMHFLTYDKLDSFPIKSMQEAFYDLPLDVDGPVDLKSCSLVYYYRNSILQPCYLFEGEYADGREFKSFITASIFR